MTDTPIDAIHKKEVDASVRRQYDIPHEHCWHPAVIRREYRNRCCSCPVDVKSIALVGTDKIQGHLGPHVAWTPVMNNCICLVTSSVDKLLPGGEKAMGDD